MYKVNVFLKKKMIISISTIIREILFPLYLQFDLRRKNYLNIYKILNGYLILYTQQFCRPLKKTMAI